MITKIYGAPGTGKTTFVLDKIKKSGIPADRVAFVSFTRKAVREAIERTQGDVKPPYFKTIHAMCMRLVRYNKKPAHEYIEDFAKKYKYNLSKDMITKIKKGLQNEIQRPTQADRFYEGMQQQRNSLLSTSDLPSALKQDLSAYQKFCADYREWMEETGYLDFTGMLEKALEKEVSPPVDLLVVDEWQDNTPLQTKVIEMWTSSVPDSIHAGDDDQTIHEWAGARAENFLNFPEGIESEEIVLDTSYRLQPNLLSMYCDFMSQNKKRKEKVVTSKKEGKADISVVRKEALFEELREKVKNQEEVVILFRTNYLASLLKNALEKARVPYQMTNRDGAVGKEIYEAVALFSIFEKIFFSSDDLRLLATSDLVPKSKVFKHGKSKELIRLADQGKDLYELPEIKPYITEAFLNSLYGVTEAPDLKTPRSRYYREIYRLYGANFTPVKIGTIHSFKGGEQDNVYLSLDITKKVYLGCQNINQLEEERRVFGVGISRAREKLTFIAPTSYYKSPFLSWLQANIHKYE